MLLMYITLSISNTNNKYTIIVISQISFIFFVLYMIIIRQSRYQELPLKLQRFVEKSVTEVRNRKTTILELLGEGWNPWWYIFTVDDVPVGMYRLGPINERMISGQNDNSGILYRYPSFKPTSRMKRYLAGVVILKKFRGRGYGSKMLENIPAGTILEVHNKIARHLYSTKGFRVLMRNKKYNEVLMVK